MDTLDRIYDMMYCELDEIAKKDKLDSKDVELIDKFVDIIKDIDQISMSQDNGYSQVGGSSYNNGSSYMRGRSGRMMPMYGRNSSYSRGRSMNGSYSHGGNRDELLDQLQDIMEMANDDKDRKAIERLINQMSNQN